MMIKFTIPGEPRGKGRPRFSNRGGYVRTYTDEKTASYENLVKMEYQWTSKGYRYADGEVLKAGMRPRLGGYGMR